MYFAPLNYWPKRYWPQGYWPAPTPNAVEVNALASTATAQTLVVAPGTATVALDAASLAALAEVVSAFGGEMSVSLGVLGMTGAVGDVVISISVNLAAVGLTGTARVTVVVPGAIASALASVYGTLAAEQVVIVPGEAAVALDALVGLLVARTAEITGVILDHTVVLEALGLSSVAQSLNVRPGPMVVPLQAVGLSAEVYRLIIFTLLGCAIASARTRAEATISARATAFAVLNDRTGCQ